jgi:hypothetical protein
MKKILLSLALTFCVASAQTPDYAIQFDRKSVVGEHYRMVSTGSDEQSVLLAIDGAPRPARELNYTFELVAACEVLAVTDKGHENKLQLTIEKLTRTAGGKATDVLPAGTVVVAARVDIKTTFAVGDVPVTPATANLLETGGVHLAVDHEPGDDEVYGTHERKKVGDTWSINAAAAAESLAKRGLPVDPSKITGSATVAELTEQNGIPAIRVDAKFGMHGITPPMPQGMTLDSSEFTATFTGLLPTDGIKRRLQEAMTMSMNVSASGSAPNGATMAMTMTKKTTRETKFVRN